MERIMKNVLKTLIVFAAMFLLTGCGGGKDKKLVEGMISDLEYACNHYDVQKILDHVDPDIADPIKFLYGIGALVSDTDKDEMAEQIVNSVFGGLYSMGVSEDVTVETFFKSMKLEPIKYKMKKKAGKVSCRLTFESMNQTFKKFVEVSVIRFDGDWYVSSMRLLSTEEAAKIED